MKEEIEHNKKYENLKDWVEAAKSLGKFQSLHNLIRNDFIELLNITNENKNNEVRFDSLYRASLKSFFSLIEADLFALNKIDEYFEYFDLESFDKKFKKTFKQIARTWEKVEIQKFYFDTKLQNLLKLKKVRDSLIHPKDKSNIIKASEMNFKQLNEIFYDYDKFINKLMDNFFISIELK